MPKIEASNAWLVLLWAALVFGSLLVRPLIPVDETRYVSVAWEMWQQHEFLVPHLNGETYSHKPPLLFWMMQLSWWIFGVNDWSARLISPSFGLAALFLTGRIAALLWPDDRKTARISPFILLGGYVWAVFGTLTMFDVLLAFFVLLGILAIVKLARQGVRLRDCGLFAVAIGGGVLSKGPVILLHLLPVALLMPWWMTHEARAIISLKKWYVTVLLAVLGGAAMALAWAVPAGMAGGEAYRKAIFLGQTSGRVVDSFAHKLPWWWYVQLLPLFALPWAFTKSFWSGFASLAWQERGIRFCVAWVVPVFIGFSIISGKRIHYLVPLLPALSLLIAKAMADLPEIPVRNHRWYMLLLGIIGLLLCLLTALNNNFYWLKDFIGLSPLWGGLIAVAAASLGFKLIDGLERQVLSVTAGSVLSVLALAAGYFSCHAERYDTVPTARKIAELQSEGHHVAMLTYKYHGQFQFTGRLTHPIQILLSSKELLDRARQYPDDYFVVAYKQLAETDEKLFVFRHPLKSQMVGIIDARSLTANAGLVKSLIP